MFLQLKPLSQPCPCLNCSAHVPWRKIKNHLLWLPGMLFICAVHFEWVPESVWFLMDGDVCALAGPNPGPKRPLAVSFIQFRRLPTGNEGFRGHWWGDGRLSHTEGYRHTAHPEQMFQWNNPMIIFNGSLTENKAVAKTGFSLSFLQFLSFTDINQFVWAQTQLKIYNEELLSSSEAILIQRTLKKFGGFCLCERATPPKQRQPLDAPDIINQGRAAQHWSASNTPYFQISPPDFPLTLSNHK